MNIKKIEIYSESGKFDREINKARVYYEDGHDVKLENVQDITMEVAKFLQQENMEIDDLINDKDKLPIIKFNEKEMLKPIEEEKTKEEPKVETPAPKDVPKTEEEEKEEKKSWFSKLKKPLVFLGVLVTLTFVGSNVFQKGNDYSSKRTGTPKKTITQEFKDTPVEDNGSKYLANLQQYIDESELYAKIQAYLNGSNKTEENLSWILKYINHICQSHELYVKDEMDGKNGKDETSLKNSLLSYRVQAYLNGSNKTEENLLWILNYMVSTYSYGKDELYYNVQDYLKGSNKTEDNLTSILDDISNKCQTNIEGLYQFIENGKTMTGDFYHLALQKMYDESDVNYAILEKFSSLREKVIEKCYSNDKEATISALRNFYNYAIDFVYCDVPMSVNGRDVRFYDNDVNPFTRHAILTLTTLLMEINKIDYNAMIGNSVYPIDELRTFINSTHNSLVEIMYENVSRKSY